MFRSIPVTLAMAMLLPLGVSSQADTMQMHEHMQAMHQQMMQMHGQAGGQAMEGMSGMAQQRAGTCVVSGSQVGLSALLLGSVGDLGLTEEQTSSLQAILEKARSDALEALTPEQRQRLEAAPAAPSVVCPRTQPSTGAGG